jgi:uncharacterized membrane protein HdeD (DUF308 family)
MADVDDNTSLKGAVLRRRFHVTDPGPTETVIAATVVPPLAIHRWKAALASGILAVILGALILGWPGISVLVASVLFGVVLLALGCAQVFFGLATDVSTGGRILLFLSGAVSLILAVLTFRHFGDAFAVLLLAIWVGIGFILRGVSITVSAIGDPLLSGRGWQIFFGVISVIAGTILIAVPFASILTLAIVVGISLVVLGVFEIVSAFKMRRRGDAGEISVNLRRPKAA